MSKTAPGNPYGEPPPCEPDCLCQCRQPGCACREQRGPFVPNRIPSPREAAP